MNDGTAYVCTMTMNDERWTMNDERLTRNVERVAVNEERGTRNGHREILGNYMVIRVKQK